MNISNNEWHGVPQDWLAAWRHVFNSAGSCEKAHLFSECPVCGAKSLYRYFSLERVQPREMRGQAYRGPGSYWEWCASCHSYEHMFGYVPEWWDVEPVDIEHSQLNVIPDLIDQALRCR